MAAPPNSTTFRDMVAAISPSWLQGFVGLRFMYSMAIQFDAIADAAAYAVRARFPDLAPPDAFINLQNDRQIDQGFNEPLTSYATRLTQWLDRWSHAGSPFGLLMAVRGYIAPLQPMVETVNNNGVWDYYTALEQDGPSTPPTDTGLRVHVPGGPPAVTWPWDNSSFPYLHAIAWWRVWVIIYCGDREAPWSPTTQTYGGGGLWGDAGAYGCTITPSQLSGLLNVVKKWKADNTWVPWIILSFTDTSYKPDGTGVQPDGRWGTWSKVVQTNGRPQYVPSRDGNSAFLLGVM